MIVLGACRATPAEAAPEFLRAEINNQTHLTYRRYPSENPRGIVLYLHGISSHSGWYIQSCEILAEHGYTVYAADRRGSGLNPIDRGHLQNYEDLIADMDFFLARVRADHPNLPIYLLGVSWGGKLALLYQGMRPTGADGVILSTPGIRTRVDLNLWEKLKVLYFSWRRREIQPDINIPIRTEQFTDDIDWQNWIEQDRLTLRKCTARFYWESYQMDRKLKKMIRRCRVPVLLQLAGRDEIVHNKKTRRFLEKKLPSSDEGELEVIVYEEARHTLEFEENMRPILMDLIHWLDRQTENPRAGEHG